jgi:hypothetical protein
MSSSTLSLPSQFGFVSNNFCPVATTLPVSNGCGELLRVVVNVPDFLQMSGTGRIGLELLDQRAVQSRHHQVAGETLAEFIQ